ncbi:MAG: clan AA aspartic protease [Gemmatimonadetes bacterium]|nr:clan AA aspartic protease [Gemmatimonadota bacterium]
MIAGVVSDSLDATIPLSVRDASGHLHEVTTVVDTGFNGFLTLPPAVVRALRLPWIATLQGLLADGQVALFPMYEATVLWNGQLRTLEAGSTESIPLVGMAMLHGSDLRIRVTEGGPVVIQPIE